MLDSLYHMAIKLFQNTCSIYWCENTKILPFVCKIDITIVTECYQICEIVNH